VQLSRQPSQLSQLPASSQQQRELYASFPFLELSAASEPHEAVASLVFGVVVVVVLLQAAFDAGAHVLL